MSRVSALNQQILEHVKALPEKDKREVAKKCGERFTSLEELQKEYA